MRIAKYTLPPAMRHRRFVLLWVGLIISTAGSQMQTWALLWHMRTLTENPIAVSGIGAARLIPILLFSPIGGIIADRYNRRKVMFAAQFVAMLVALALWGLTFAGLIQLWHIYMLTAVQAAAVSIDLPARQSIWPNIVPAKDLPSAFSLSSIAFNVGSVVGPGLSGMVIGYLGQHYTYLINAVSFLAVILALIAIGPVPQAVIPAARHLVEHFKSIREGARYIQEHPIILSTMLLDFFATLFANAHTLLPFVARDILHVGPVAYGWLSAAPSIGAVTAAARISVQEDQHHQGRAILLSVGAYGVAGILFGLSRDFTFSMLALALFGASDSVSTVFRNTIRQLQTPDHLRGRIVSINQIFFIGGPQLGEIEAGLVAQFFGVPFAIITGGATCILAAGLIAWRYPALRSYRGDEPAAAMPAGG